MRLSRVRRVLDGEVTPLVYLLVFVNMCIGLFFLTGVFMSPTSSVLYNNGVLVERHLWGGLLTAVSFVGLLGLALKKDGLIGFTGMVGFMLWLFASISLVLAGHWYVFVTIGLTHILFHVYLSLAVSAKVLRRKCITDEQVSE